MKSVSSSQMALRLPPCSPIPSTSLHLPILLLCSFSKCHFVRYTGVRAREEHRQGFGQERLFLYHSFVKAKTWILDEKTPDSPRSDPFGGILPFLRSL